MLPKRQEQAPSPVASPRPETAAPALDIAGLGFSYGRKHALEDVTFTIRAGETVILLGPNGAGKTTLFALIAGLFSPREGAISIAGRNLGLSGAAALEPLGIVFQAQTLDLDLTVRQNLRYFCALRGMSRVEAELRIAGELSRLGMAGRIDEKVRALNGGHRRRVEIARSVLHRPKILLLDEPTVGLDIPTRRDLIVHLHGMGAGGLALLWATHLIDEVDDTDRVLIIHEGRLVGDGRPADLARKTGTSNLAEAYRRLTGQETER